MPRTSEMILKIHELTNRQLLDEMIECWISMQEIVGEIDNALIRRIRDAADLLTEGEARKLTSFDREKLNHARMVIRDMESAIAKAIDMVGLDS